MNPLVSVIMPAYNGEKYIGKAIESILSQTYSNWELVIVEDASADNTLCIINQYRNERIRLIVNRENKGIAYSTNLGIKNAKGKYIALLDDDDIAPADRLWISVDYMECHEKIDILGGSVIFIDEKGTFLKSQTCPRNNPKYIKAMLLFAFYCIPNGSAMIRKKLIDDNGLKYQDDCYGMQDLKFWIDSSKVGNITTIDDCLLYYRRHGENETNRMLRNNLKARNEKLKEFQRESLMASGFMLEEDELKIITSLFNREEIPRYRCKSFEEIYALYKVLVKILEQGKRMKIDYYEELNHLCKHMLAKKITDMERLA